MSTNQREGGAGVEAMLREHVPALGRVCMALVGDPRGAASALEQIARDAGAKALPEGVAPRTWLMSLARSACATHLSKLPLRTSHRTGGGDASRDGGEAESAPKTSRIGTSDPALARKALARLKPSEREALVLHVVGGLDATEVATACGIELDAARSRIARAVTQLVEIEEREAKEEGSGR